MTKFGKVLGIFVGLVIIALSVVVFMYDVDSSNIQLDFVYAPGSEPEITYGGDAYTGIQQAAAQTANNLICVFDAVEANSAAIKTLNKNIVELIDFLQFTFGCTLLAFGLYTFVKYLGATVVKKEKKVTVVTESPLNNQESVSDDNIVTKEDAASSGQ